MKYGMNNKLTREQEALLDEKLASPAQMQIAQMVRSLPEVEPEPAWRSELSARLHHVAHKKRRTAWVLRPAMGLGLAGALAVAFMLNPSFRSPVQGSPRPALEAQILSAHKETVQLEQFWGAVRADEEARAVAVPAAYQHRWEESDLSTF